MSAPSEPAGTLYIVATPIGNLDDITFRAVRILGEVDTIAAEDTRHSARLLQHLGISKPLLALHEHNERERSSGLLDRIAAGESVALISDAGTPLISDPGYVLVRQARERGIRVSPVPGPSALTAALSAAGLATDRFVFEGFLPGRTAARKTALERLKKEPATLIFYEAPRRVGDLLADIAEVMGGDREVVIARELTKAFETFYNGRVDEVILRLAADPYADKGEFVVMLAGAADAGGESADLDVDRLLELLLPELPVKKVARIAATLTGLSRNDLYQRALDLRGS